MKKTISIFLITFLVHKLNAQDFNPTAGSYITNTTMGAFHGTWRWINGTDTVKIYLNTKKTFFDINGGFYWDRLVGWHIYKKGNVIVERSYDDIDDLFFQSTFLMGNEDDPTNTCSGNFDDLTKNKNVDITLTLNAAGNQLTWHLEPSPGLKVRKSGSPPYQQGFTLPANMVLIKQ